MIDPLKDEQDDFRPSALDERISRLHCHCLMDEYAERLEVTQGRIETFCDQEKYGSAIRQCQLQQRTLHELHDKEVKEFNYWRARAMIDMFKLYVLNGHPPLQTSPWAMGALNKLRNPPKKKSKKEQMASKKRAKVQQAAGKKKKIKE